MSASVSSLFANPEVKLLRLHGSYQLDQLSNREMENGLVNALNPNLNSARLGRNGRHKSQSLIAVHFGFNVIIIKHVRA
ncbi:hypothetical protein K1719_036878 [Acacia pycnantha]|nr:hypothetical protein K1719_036878 [Acacia pycnantha]